MCINWNSFYDSSICSRYAGINILKGKKATRKKGIQFPKKTTCWEVTAVFPLEPNKTWTCEKGNGVLDPQQFITSLRKMKKRSCGVTGLLCYRFALLLFSWSMNSPLQPLEWLRSLVKDYISLQSEWLLFLLLFFAWISHFLVCWFPF